MEPTVKAYLMEEKLDELKIQYKEKFGETSLDGVPLYDPLHYDYESVKRAYDRVKNAIDTNTPLEQIDEENWKQMIF